MKRWVVVLAVGLTLLLGVPLAWALTRPAASAGMSLGQALGAASPDTEPVISVAPHVEPSSGPPSRSSSGPSPAEPGGDPATPARLRIAAIEVDAAVTPVGVDQNGTMTVPRAAAQVGWYRFGPAPGSVAGAAVLAGHVDSRDQGPGALYRLREVPVGATVEVVDDEGVSRRYRVVSRERITKKALPTQVLFRRTGPPRLILITCGGEFDAQLHSYRDNVVVVAQPQP